MGSLCGEYVISVCSLHRLAVCNKLIQGNAPPFRESHFFMRVTTFRCSMHCMDVVARAVSFPLEAQYGSEDGHVLFHRIWSEVFTQGSRPYQLLMFYNLKVASCSGITLLPATA